MDFNSLSDADKYSLLASKTPNLPFFYAVTTTKIFCLPTCGARLPRQSNTRFFPTAAAAQAAGFRACKRCKPLSPPVDAEAERVKKALEVLDAVEEGERCPGLEALASGVGVTRWHFLRGFRRVVGGTPREYLAWKRERERKEREGGGLEPGVMMLRDFGVMDGTSEGTMTESSVASPSPMEGLRSPQVVDEDLFGFVDFGEPVAFGNDFDDMKLPSSQEARNLLVHYDIVDTELGVLLVAFQNREVCKVQMGHSREGLLAWLESEYPSLYYLQSSVDLADPKDAVNYRRLTSDVVANLGQAVQNSTGLVTS